MEIRHILATFKEGVAVSAMGRISAKRKHGLCTFYDLRDATGTMQLLVDSSSLPEFSSGDIVQVTATTQLTRTGERTLIAQRANAVAICRESLPFKTGLVNREQRLELRHVDLMVNPQLTRFFAFRSHLMFTLRERLAAAHFLEFDTATLQSRFDAGFAKPFSTRFKALGRNFYLRLTSEMRLKQLIAAGFDRVYEFGKSFRNEGIDAVHNPEFTLLELYQAMSDESKFLPLVVELLQQSVAEAAKLAGYHTENLDAYLTAGWPTVSTEYLGKQRFSATFSLTLTKGELIKLCAASGVLLNDNLTLGQLLDDCLERSLAPMIVQPTLLTHIPAAISPLAKPNSEVDGAAQRTWLVVDGTVVADIYVDENDPDVLAANLIQQAAATSKPPNESFLHAIRCGMPPTVGAGIGIDRLLLWLRPSGLPKNIREVILFPNV